MSQAASLVVSWWDVTKILLRSQLYAVLFFGLLSTTVVYIYWGFSLDTLQRVGILYILSYIGYAAFYACVPLVTLWPIRRAQAVLQQGGVLDDQSVVNFAKFLLNYPWKTSLGIYLLYIFSLVIYIFVIPPASFLPETLSVLQEQQFYLFLSGVVLASIAATLNFISLERLIFGRLAGLAHDYPVILSHIDGVRTISLFSKIFIVVLVTVLSGPSVAFAALMVKLAITYPGEVQSSIVFTTLFGFSTVLYTIFVTRFFTKTLGVSLAGIVAWSGQVVHGQRGMLYLRTNDELQEVAQSANHMVASLNELTARVEQDRDVLAAERSKLSFILRYIDDGVIACNESAEVVSCNQTGLALLHLDADEVIGQPIDKILHLENDSGHRVEVGDHITSSSSHRTWRRRQLRLVTKRGRARYVDIYAVRPNDPAGIDLWAIIALHDVTQEKELELMKLDFVSMAAHELRTPLTSMRGYLSLLLESAEGKLDKEELSFLSRSLISGNQLATLIENLLTVSRIERGAMQLDLAQQSMVEMSRGVVASLEEIAKQKQVELRLNEPEQPVPNVWVDKFRIVEVMTNLIANAINYTPAGGMVAVRIEQRGHQVVFHVTDTGPGIPAEAQDRLFTKFYRATSKLGQNSKGTGLGLFISKEIIDAHHGRIWFETEEGKGSTFSFALPTDKPKLANAPTGINLQPPH